MKKIILLVIFGLFPILTYSQKTKNQKSKKKISTTKTSTNTLTPADLEVIKYRQENPDFYKAHIVGLTTSYTNTGVDYSNFNGKNCSEIAKKEKWSAFNPPKNADEKCKKYIAQKKK